jgi:Ca2+-binding RTX toxin-like protein
MPNNDTLIGRKKLRKAVVAVAALMLMAVGAFASVAHAATIRGTDDHDWGKAKDEFMDPPGCMTGCGKMIHGTDASDTIYGLKGWDYIAAYRGADEVQGGPGMEIIQGGDGDDRIFGQRGHDHVFGGSGNDRSHLEDGKDEPGNVEQVSGDGGRDLCVVDEDPKDGVIVNVSCETLVMKSVPDMSGATKIYNTRNAKDRGDTIPGEFYPGTYHLN